MNPALPLETSMLSSVEDINKQQCQPENGVSNDLKKEGQSRIPVRDMSWPPMDHIQ